MAWRRRTLIGAGLFLCCSRPSYAAEAGGDRFLRLAFENDLSAHADDYYSNGIRLTYLSPKNDVWSWLRQTASLMPTIDADADMRVEHALGQEIYTPRDTAAEPPAPNDRPYAGWLYYSLGVTAEKGEVLDQLQLTIGIVGADAQAGAVQRTVHHLFGGEVPKGWDHQLKNEPGINAGYFRTWRQAFDARTDGYEFDLSPYAGGMIGNVSTYAAVGVTARFGRNLPLDYGLPRAQPSMPGGFYFKPETGFHWYAFAGVARPGRGAQHLPRGQQLHGQSQRRSATARRGSESRVRPCLVTLARGLHTRVPDRGVRRAGRGNSLRCAEHFVPVVMSGRSPGWLRPVPECVGRDVVMTRLPHTASPH